MATIKYWNGSAWELAIVGKQGPAGPTGPTGPAGSASLQRFRFVATGGETSLSGTDANGNTLAYTAGLEEVFLNGSALVRGQDYTATNGTSITGLTALVASDVVEILAWGVFNVSNTISNTLIDAKGDILAGSAADTVSRLAVGADNTVLTADSSTATGLKWATASSGGMTLLASGSLSGSTVTMNSISGSYKNLVLYVRDWYWTTSGLQFQFRLNGDSNANRYVTQYATYDSSTLSQNALQNNKAYFTYGNVDNQDRNFATVLTIFDYAQSSARKMFQSFTTGLDQGTYTATWFNKGAYNQSSAITSIEIAPEYGGGASFAGGTYELYGVS